MLKKKMPPLKKKNETKNHKKPHSTTTTSRRLPHLHTIQWPFVDLYGFPLRNRLTVAQSLQQQKTKKKWWQHRLLFYSFTGSRPVDTHTKKTKNYKMNPIMSTIAEFFVFDWLPLINQEPVISSATVIFFCHDQYCTNSWSSYKFIKVEKLCCPQCTEPMYVSESTLLATKKKLLRKPTGNPIARRNTTCQRERH